MIFPLFRTIHYLLFFEKKRTYLQLITHINIILKIVISVAEKLTFA